MNKPIEEIQLDFIGPKQKNRKIFFYLQGTDLVNGLQLSYAKQRRTNGGQIFRTIQKQYKNGIPKTIRTDKATAFTGRTFREFCKSHQIKIIYGTPYIHTPTGLVERGVRTVKKHC